MRAVLYAAYDMEPITVLELDEAKWEYIKQYGYLRLAVINPPSTVEAVAAMTNYRRAQPYRQVTITGEALIRNGHELRMLFTSNEEDALLLKAAFLPGQRSSLNKYQREAFAKGFASAWLNLG